ncbi:MAG TPA: patatin-like phospholipase family protein [Thermomicrobiales bacterium]
MNPQGPADHESGDRERWPWAAASLFRGLGTEGLSRIAGQLTVRPFTAGEILIRQGVWRGALFIIRTGVVQISLEPEADPSGGGSRPALPLRRLAAGECFGEMSLITGQLPSATARALTDGEVWTIDQEGFSRLVTAQPELSRNINTILSERLLHTNRQQVAEKPAQVIVAVDGEVRLWRAVAAMTARLSSRAVLLVDLTGRAQDDDFTLADLLGGRLHPGASTTGMVTGEGALTVVRGTGDEDATSLPASLGRLEAAYHLLFVVLPGDHSLLTTQLLAYATRTLVAGRADALHELRHQLTALPLAEATGVPADIGAIITAAPQRLRRTVATLDLLDAELGAPVRAIVPDGGEPYTRELAAFGRWLVGQRIGLVFGAGGPKGFAQVGALRVLRRAGLPVDVVAGTSVGALIGGGVAMEMPTEAIEASVTTLIDTLFRPTVPLHAILSSRALARWARGEQAFGNRLLEDLPIPYAVSAADLTVGREIVIRRGRLWQAVMASAAIPGIYPPVMIGKHWLVDGGVVNPVPVSIAQLLGADLIVALDLSEPLAPRQELILDDAPAPRVPYLPDTLLRSRDIMMSEIRSHTVGEPAVLINPKVAGVSLRNVRDAAPYTAAGEAATEEVLPRLRRLLPWLGKG